MQNSEAFTGSLVRSKLVGLEKRTEALESTTLALAARLAVLEGASQALGICQSKGEPISVGPSEAMAASPLQMPEIQAPIQAPAAFSAAELAAIPTPRTSSVKLMAAQVPDDADSASASAVAVPLVPAHPRASIESRIGLYWLSKLGIGFLVIGVALLIMYSFGNFGPVAKVATGFIVAAALMALGEYMEREGNMPWYARLIEGGAWALGYFTTYAMYHVQSVRIINNPLIDSVLLLGVAGLAVYHATCKRSEIMAIFAIVLGFITLALSHATLFTGLASAVLVALSVFLSVRQSWSRLYLCSVFASYGALIYCGSLEPIANLSDSENFRTIALLLWPSLIGFSLMPFFFRVGNESESSRQTIGCGIISNTIAFCSLFLSHAYSELGTDASFCNIAVGAWFFIVAHLYDRKGFSFLSSLCGFWALTISTFYFSGAAMGERTWPWLALETAFVVWVGLRHKLKTFRWFGTILGPTLVFGNLFMIASPKVMPLFGLTVPFVLLSVSCAVAALLFAAFLQRKASFAQSCSHSDRKTNFFIFWHEALFLAWLLPISLMCVSYDKVGCLPENMQTPFLICAWSALACAVLFTGIKLRSRYISILAFLLSLWSAVPICALWHFSWAFSAGATAAIFVAAFLFRHFKMRFAQPVDEIAHLETSRVENRLAESEDAPFGTRLFQAQYLIAFIVAAVLPLSAGLDTQGIIVYWSLQAIIGLLLGAQIGDGFVRMLTAVLLPVAAVAAFYGPIDWPFALPVMVALWSAWALYRSIDWCGAWVPEVAREEGFGQNAGSLLPGKWLAATGIARGEHDVRHIYSVLATMVLCACIAVQMQGSAQSIAWLCQGLVLLLSGLSFKDRVLRYSAIGSSALLTLHLLPGACDYNVVLPVVVGFFAAWEIYRLAFRTANDQEVDHEVDCRHFYSVAASGLLAACFGHRLLTVWISSGWAGEATVLLLAGVLLRDRVLRMTSLAVSLSLVFRLMLSPLQLEQVVPAVLALYVGWGLYRPDEYFGLDAWERDFRHIYSIAGGLLLSWGLAVEMHNTWVSCAWAVQGVVTLLVGFIYREKVMRVHGLCLFGALTVRLFFIDLAAAPTVYRIFAFIVTGCILLLSAYGYNWFARRFDGEEGLSIAPSEGSEMPEGCA